VVIELLIAAIGVVARVDLHANAPARQRAPTDNTPLSTPRLVLPRTDSQIDRVTAPIGIVYGTEDEAARRQYETKLTAGRRR